VELISSEQGLAEFRRYSGFGAALDALESNPLPHVLKIRPDPAASMPNEVEALKRYLSSWPEVDVVSVDTDWVRRFNAILEVLRSLLVVASAVLAVGVLAVVGNTIRLEILNRRPEIEVTKLVGGTNAFVRRPFLYTGVLYGVAGALLAWAIVATSIAALAGPTAGLARAYGSRFELVGLGAADVGALLLAGTLLGLSGAWISSARHLARIEPKA
jgi:cell division transport system permease protein